MTPNDSIEGPARWKLIEATNGYDLDNSLYQNPGPVPRGQPPRSRSGRPGLAVARFLSALSAAQRRRRKRPVGPAGAVGSKV
jgi:hypothetical protein